MGRGVPVFGVVFHECDTARAIFGPEALWFGAAIQLDPFGVWICARSTALIPSSLPHLPVRPGLGCSGSRMFWVVIGWMGGAWAGTRSSQHLQTWRRCKLDTFSITKGINKVGASKAVPAHSPGLPHSSAAQRSGSTNASSTAQCSGPSRQARCCLASDWITLSAGASKSMIAAQDCNAAAALVNSRANLAYTSRATGAYAFSSAPTVWWRRGSRTRSLCSQRASLIAQA